MSKLKKFANFFVTIETEDDGVVSEAASPNLDEAARAARDRAVAGPVGKPVQKRVKDLPEVHFEEEDDFDIEALEREISQMRGGGGSSPPAQPQARTGVFAQSAAPSSTPSGGQGFVPKSFDEIYDEEGLPSELSQEFTVYTIEQLLSNPHLVNLPDSTKKASLMVALQARNVTVGDVIEDARRRDHALDYHDAHLMDELLTLEEQTQARNQEVEDRINALLEELRMEIQTNNEKLIEARELYDEWKRTKVAEEERLFSTIRHLVEPGENPVSVDN